MIDYFLLIENYYFVNLPPVLKKYTIYAKNLFFINFLIYHFLRTTG